MKLTCVGGPFDKTQVEFRTETFRYCEYKDINASRTAQTDTEITEMELNTGHYRLEQICIDEENTISFYRESNLDVAQALEHIFETYGKLKVKE